MTNVSKQLAFFLLTILVTSLFCLGLYEWNNKYTHSTVQPSHGQLVITEEYLQDFHYLIDGWEFYPDVLLNPNDFREKASGRYMVYTSIGERTRFDGMGTRDNPHGCGTYVMHLWLPEDTRPYALELPEIYSSYRLYINGKYYFEVGNPDPNHYISRTQTRLVTFDGAGHTTIIIAASDYSHFYSGMVYPPAFGISSQVVKMREIRLGITLAANTIGLLFALFSAIWGLRLKKNNALLFSLLCLVTCMITSFPVLHTFVELPVSPWYTLELACIYLMVALVIFLHNRICDTGFFSRRLSTGIAVVFCILSICYGWSAPSLTVPIMRMFSSLLYAFKIGCAAYLLITAAFSLHAKDSNTAPLYYASISHAVFFVWDRIFPDFEPIFYGWFSDWSNVVLVIAIGYTLCKDLMDTYTNHLAFAEEHRQMARQLAMQGEYLRRLQEQTKETQKLTHDFRQHIHTISVLAGQMKSSPENMEYYENLHAYLKQISGCFHTPFHYMCGAFSSNAAADALLQYYYLAALEKQISVDIRLQLPSSIPLTDIELCTVLGNLLENAMEACRRLPDTQKPHIGVLSSETEHVWFLLIENTYDGVVLKKHNRFLSRKDNGARMGIGMESVREIVARHEGTVDIYPQEQLFRVGITLPL